MPYFANVRQEAGRYSTGSFLGSIGVLAALNKLMPIGQADSKTWDRTGWRFGRRIGGQPIEGR